MERLTEEDWSWVLDVNVMGTVAHRARVPADDRERSGWRRIGLTASAGVLSPSVRMAAYQTSKFAVMGFGETLREEVRDEGIGVSILFPHGMMTRHLESSVAARPAELGTSTLDMDDVNAMLAHAPMRPCADGRRRRGDAGARHPQPPGRPRRRPPVTW